MQSLNTDIDSIGGGMGGFGNGSNPLLWLITLGFLKDGSLGGGNNNSGAANVLAGETQAKLDCLSQQHQTLQSQLTQQSMDARFTSLGLGITELAGIERDNAAAFTNTLNDLRAEAAKCCCETQLGIQGINTSIANQTAVLTATGQANTQKILDRMCANEITSLTADNVRLQSQLNKAEILEAIALKGKGNS